MSLSVKNGSFLVDQKRLELTLSLAPGETKGIYGASGTSFPSGKEARPSAYCFKILICNFAWQHLEKSCFSV